MFFLLRVVGTFIILLVFLSFLFQAFFGRDLASNVISTLPQIELSSESNTFFQQNIDGGDLIVSSTDSKKNIINNAENTQITVVSTGKNLFSLYDVSQKYILNGEGYKIEQLGLGDIYIDSATNEGKVFVYSLNTILRITLQNTDATKEYTDIILYPNMYIELDPSRGKFLINADKIRVQTVFDLGYMPEVRDNVYTKNEFFKEIQEYISKRNNLYRGIKTEVINADILDLPGQEIIEKYMNFFINDEKKRVFFQNMILKNYQNILAGEIYNEKLVTETQEQLVALQLLDEKSYIELRNMAKVYFTLGYASHTSGVLSSSTVSFLEIYNSSINTHKYFIDSFSEFVNTHAENTEEKSIFMEYYLYFLSEQAVQVLQNSSETFSLESLTRTLEKHVQIIESRSDMEVNTQISMLYDYGKLLEEIHIFTRSYYFEEERNGANLLVVQGDKNVSKDSISRFADALERIYTIFEENKKFLDVTDQRDRGIIKSVSNSKIYLREYLSALQSYESYTIEYDELKKNLLELGNTQNSEEKILTEDSLKLYFSQFSGVSLANARVQIEDNYYSVQGAYVGGKSVNFDLYPDFNHRIQNIVLDNEAISYVYKLDDIKELWSEKYMSMPVSERDNYDFQNFFTITFFSERIKQVQNFDFGEISPNEDKAEIVFKRDILLGDRGEFTPILQTLPLEYRNIKLQKNEDNYDIFIEGAPLNISGTSSNSGYRAALDAKYTLSETEHFFTDMSIRVYSGQETSIIPLFGQTEILVSGRVQLDDFSNIIAEISSSLNSYYSLYQELFQIGNIQNLVINYSSRIRKMTFTFDLDSKKYTILLDASEIESLLRGTTKLNQESIEISGIRSYF